MKQTKKLNIQSPPSNAQGAYRCEVECKCEWGGSEKMASDAEIRELGALCLISMAWFLSREGVSCGVEQWSRSMNRRKILLRNNHHLRQPHSHPVQQQLLLSPFHRLGPWGVERNGTCLWPHVYEVENLNSNLRLQLWILHHWSQGTTQTRHATSTS